MATIVGVPKKLVICGKTIKVAEINFLAIHRALRNKRMAQIMIQEMMRRKRLNGFPQAYYTSGHSMPTPFCTSHYMNRFLEPQKLVEVRYTYLPTGMTMKQFVNKWRLPEKKGIKIEGNIRDMQKKDASAVLKLFN